MSTNSGFDEISTMLLFNDFLVRERLNVLFEKAANKPIITVIAGAGYGKTQGVSMFLNSQKQNSKTLWLTLSKLDNLTIRFWDRITYLISLESQELAQKLASVGFPNTILEFNNFLKVISSTQNKYRRHYFVLDDFNLISESKIIKFIENLVRSNVYNLNIILISRSKPNINTIGLVSKNMLFAITEQDLRFTKEEMQEYFKMQNIKISEQTFLLIYNYTQGWIFAIYIMAMSYKGENAQNILYQNKPLSILKMELFKLLDIELFSTLCKDTQKFLVKLSLAEQLPFELVKTIAAKKTCMLEETMEISSFIKNDAMLNVFLIHPLFLDFLLTKKSLLSNKEIKNVLTVCADWYLKNEMIADAILCYQKTNNNEGVLNAAFSAPKRCSTTTADFILSALNDISEEFCKKNPFTNILKAKFLANNFKMQEAMAQISKVIEQYETSQISQKDKLILGEAYVVKALISLATSLFDGVYHFETLFKKAHECLPNGSVLYDNTLHLTASTYVCCDLFAEKECFEKRKQAVQSSFPYAAKVMHGCSYGFWELFITEEAYFQKDLKNSKKNAYKAIYKAQQQQQYDIENLAIFYLMRIDVACGHYSEIPNYFLKLKEQIEKYKYPECYASRDIIQGWFFASVGDVEKVETWIKEGGDGWNQDTPITFAFDRLVRAKCLMKQKKYFEFLAFLEKRKGQLYLEEHLIGSIELNVLKSIALYHINEPIEALRVFEKTYNISFENDFIMPFIENGSNVRTLATYALSNLDKHNIPQDWLVNIRTKASTYAKKLSSITAHYKIVNGITKSENKNLTKLEIEILTDLGHGLTRNEIADNRCLSINTIKSMLMSVYTKLGATNSIEAVRLATLLNILV